MLKYLNTLIVFQEIPDEISLAINITNCPHHCLNCHSPQLQQNTGTALDTENMRALLRDNPHISCILFMGGDANHKDIVRLSYFIHQMGLKMAMYSGDENLDNDLIQVLDFYKVGPYIESRGPLSDKKTNQKLYKITNCKLDDITYKLQ